MTHAFFFFPSGDSRNSAELTDVKSRDFVVKPLVGPSRPDATDGGLDTGALRPMARWSTAARRQSPV